VGLVSPKQATVCQRDMQNGASAYGLTLTFQAHLLPVRKLLKMGGDSSRLVPDGSLFRRHQTARRFQANPARLFVPFPKIFLCMKCETKMHADHGILAILFRMEAYFGDTRQHAASKPIQQRLFVPFPKIFLCMKCETKNAR
jgi:hypothetical protein